MKNWKMVVVVVACALLANNLVIAEKGSGGGTPATQPATQPLPEIELPQKLPAVAATVGGKEVSGEKINKIVATNLSMMNKQIESQLSAIPANRRVGVVGNLQRRMNTLPNSIRNQMIFRDMLNNLVKSRNIQASEADLAKSKHQLEENAKKQNMTIDEFMKKIEITDKELVEGPRVAKLRAQTVAPEKIAAFIRDNPSCFNGTKVQASHILIRCGSLASTAEQKAAVGKLEKIATDVKAGKVKFEEAAKESSACPSKAKGGDLGEFGFRQMVPPFAMAAFHTKVGELSGVIRTNFGFHLIKVTKRTEGEEKVDPKLPENKKVAKAVLMSQLHNDILDQALNDCPIVIMGK